MGAQQVNYLLSSSVVVVVFKECLTNWVALTQRSENSWGVPYRWWGMSFPLGKTTNRYLEGGTCLTVNSSKADSVRTVM